jgi:hypothetical protein
MLIGITPSRKSREAYKILRSGYGGVASFVTEYFP